MAEMKRKDSVAAAGANGVYVMTIIVGYLLSASSEIWTMKAITNDYHADLPTLCTMVINAYWPLQLVIYYYVRQTQDPPIRKEFPWKVYAILGISQGCTTFMRSFGIIYLTGIVYVVCANTEIVFVALLSYFVVGKNVNAYQVAGVVLIILALLFAVVDTTTWTFESDGGNSNSTHEQFITGVTLTIISRFLSACNSLIAAQMLGKNKKSPWGVHELCIAQALAPTIVLPFTLLISKENERWSELSTNTDTPGHTALGFILLALALTKLVDRTCKMSIIQAKSAIYFEGVDALMKAVAGIGSFLFWRSTDKSSWNDFVSLGVIMIAMALTVHGENVEDERAEAEKKKASEDHFSYELMETNKDSQSPFATMDGTTIKGNLSEIDEDERRGSI
jgi:drug/metabolite transporter (DMT)-like permease